MSHTWVSTVSLVCLVCVYSMSPFCNQLLNMSENGNDNVEMKCRRPLRQGTYEPCKICHIYLHSGCMAVNSQGKCACCP